MAVFVVIVIPLLLHTSCVRIVSSDQLGTESVVIIDQFLNLLEVMAPELDLKIGVQARLLGLLTGQGRGNHERIPYLSSVPGAFSFGMLGAVLVYKFHDTWFCDHKTMLSACLMLLFLGLTKSIDVDPEDFSYFRMSQTLVM